MGRPQRSSEGRIYVGLPPRDAGVTQMKPGCGGLGLASVQADTGLLDERRPHAAEAEALLAANDMSALRTTARKQYSQAHAVVGVEACIGIGVVK